jgi:hypothetical protein
VEHPVRAAPDSPAAPQMFTLSVVSAAVYKPDANLGRMSPIMRTAVNGPYRSIWVIALRKGSSEIRMRPR